VNIKIEIEIEKKIEKNYLYGAFHELTSVDTDYKLSDHVALYTELEIDAS